jgi:hypothetical protein
VTEWVGLSLSLGGSDRLGWRPAIVEPGSTECTIGTPGFIEARRQSGSVPYDYTPDLAFKRPHMKLSVGSITTLLMRQHIGSQSFSPPEVMPKALPSAIPYRVW